jgi:hypothetical protein
MDVGVERRAGELMHLKSDFTNGRRVVREPYGC